MIYWDSSALVALIVEQPATPAVQGVYRDDPEVVSWTASEVEILSALCRLEREGALTAGALRAAEERLAMLWDSVDEVIAVSAVKRRASRILRMHPLRAADALQLGAALLVAGDDPVRRSFVSLDEQLNEAARREGFSLLPG